MVLSMTLNCSCPFAFYTMERNQLVAILLTKEEIYTLRSMCHDSCTYWHHLWQKAADGTSDLDPKACLNLIGQRRKLEEKIVEIMYATHPELTDAGSEEEQEEEEDCDQVLETV
jgi:hypothetical protein